VLAAAKHTLRSLARRIQHLTVEIDDLQAQIRSVVTEHRPELLDSYGLGPDTAARLLITVGDNPDRIHSEASFASLCGVAPVEASSGNTSRRRLSGERRANTALYFIALSRMRWDPRTESYLQRRISEGKTRREALRCVKRYIARELYPLLLNPPNTKSNPARRHFTSIGAPESDRAIGWNPFSDYLAVDTENLADGALTVGVRPHVRTKHRPPKPHHQRGLSPGRN
jgi:transposase